MTLKGIIGVDSETARPQLLRVAGKFINHTESAYIPQLISTLLQAWTAKEAVYKAALTPGLGLTEITLTPDMRTATARDMIFTIDYPCLSPTRVTAVALAK